jgi:dTDP-4-dehydrorhamnose reductase
MDRAISAVPRDSGRVELWGGVECTVNRVGDVFFDQMERNGHAARLSDLAMFAGLGIRAIR